jgi:hypothetical protein
MKIRSIHELAPAETYDTARRIFAKSGRIFDLFDHSQAGFRDAVQQTAMLMDKIKNARQDFWIYETDVTPIPTAASRIKITRTEHKGPATDLESASPGKLRYINKRAEKAGLALLDYIEDRRPVVSSRVEASYTPVSFSIHALKRFWERNENGVNLSQFRDIKIAHIWGEELSRLDNEPGKLLLRTDLMVPYERGVFLGSATMKPNYTWVYTNDRLDVTQSRDHGMEPTFNAVTYIGESQLSPFQRRMYAAILEGDHQRYRQLAAKDLRQTAVEL